MTSRRHRLILFAVLLLVAVGLRVGDANPAIAQTQRIGVWQANSPPPMDGFAPDWQSVVPIFVPTTSQLVTPPMGGGSIERVAVRALHWEDRVYLMLEWPDSTADMASPRVEDFVDAVAVQFPAEAASTVPAICMGQADQAVNIWQWRADHEEDVTGLVEDAYVDSYQFTDDLYFPAREAGNPVSVSEGTAVTNLVAGGFGTLEATESGGLEGHGAYHDGRWAVVFARPLNSPGEMQPTFDGGNSMDVAFAVWDGSQEERNGIKSVSPFTQLSITPEDAPRRAVPAVGDWPAYNPSNPMVLVGASFVLLTSVGLAAALMYWRRSQSGRS